MGKEKGLWIVKELEKGKDTEDRLDSLPVRQPKGQGNIASWNVGFYQLSSKQGFWKQTLSYSNHRSSVLAQRERILFTQKFFNTCDQTHSENQSKELRTSIHTHQVGSEVVWNLPGIAFCKGNQSLNQSCKSLQRLLGWFFAHWLFQGSFIETSNWVQLQKSLNLSDQI